ncbi:MAG TPA: beta-galactosidase [Polyangiaceae bacterium]
MAGSVHYWRLPRTEWRTALACVKELGLGLVDTYVPWAVHETAPGQFDFGERDPRLDLVAFLELAAELELYAIVRPGPHINAELTYFGIPERIVWDAQCQARSASGGPVVLPVPPLAFPVPSYASKRFQQQATEWLQAVAKRVAPSSYPDGNMVLCQVDNEGAMYFRDGVYDQDYHPDAIRSYHRFLKRKYGSVEELSLALGRPCETFEIDPPRKLEAEKSRDLTLHLDWAEAQEELLARSFRRLKEVLVEEGVEVPFSHNFPVGDAMTPLDPGRVAEVVDLVGLDYYHVATPPQCAEIARRTTDLAVRSSAKNVPAFACELGAGFPPFFPALTETDNLFTALTALAYGLRGFNVYMAVERDRWIGAPYDRRGRARSSAGLWRKLSEALERVRFHELDRQAPVHLVVPRGLRRLHRVQHAFGPLSAVVFQILGRGATDAGLEDEFDLGAPFALDTETFLRWFEEELERRRIPFAVVGGDLIDYSVDHAAWSIVACAGGLERDIVRSVSRALRRGKAVSIGPHFPQRDETLVPREPPPELRHPFQGALPALIELDTARLSRLLDRATDLLGLPRIDASPEALRVTVHHDVSGRPRVLFAINPTPHPLAARIGSLGANEADDLLDGSTVHASFGAFEVPVPAKSVRFFALRP